MKFGGLGGKWRTFYWMRHVKWDGTNKCMHKVSTNLLSVPNTGHESYEDTWQDLKQPLESTFSVPLGRPKGSFPEVTRTSASPWSQIIVMIGPLRHKLTPSIRPKMFNSVRSIHRNVSITPLVPLNLSSKSSKSLKVTIFTTKVDLYSIIVMNSKVNKPNPSTMSHKRGLLWL